jgi:hypothetical protein
MQTISIGYGQFRSPEWLDELNLSPGERKTYEYLAMASKGQDHAWPSQDWLAKKVRVTTRSIRNYTRKLEEINLLMTAMERINGRLRLVYYFLAHPIVLAAAHRKNFPAKEEKFSGHLNKGKKNIQNPPYPPQGEAADAGEEGENKSKIATHVEQSAHQETAGRSSCSGTSQRAGLQIARPALADVNACRFPGKSKQLSQDTAPFPAEERGLIANSDVWQAALALLLQKLPEQEVNLWLRPTSASQTPAGLRLDYPDRYSVAWVQEHFGSDIRSALQQVGITEFYFSFGEQEKALQKEKNREMRVETARQVERQAQKLRSMPLQEQFAALLNAYPRKTSGEWFAWRTFKRLASKGELPEISELLQMIEAKRQSDDWNRDAGRWIPGLSKWLNNRPWWKIDCKERGKEPGEAVSW